MGLHKRDLTLLLLLQQYLGGVGTIHKNPKKQKNKVNYSIDSKKELIVLITNLRKVSFINSKRSRFYSV